MHSFQTLFFIAVSIVMIFVCGAAVKSSANEVTVENHSPISPIPDDETVKKVGVLYEVCTDRAVPPVRGSKYASACRAFFHGYLSGVFIGRIITISSISGDEKINIAQKTESDLCYLRPDGRVSYEVWVDDIIDDFVEGYAKNPAPHHNSYEYVHYSLVSQNNCKGL